MSTLRVSNIEAKADASSPTINEKLKVTNSNGDVLIHVNGETSGITTIGINTTGESVRFDSNQNVTFSGKVGIGTDSPKSILHLNSNATAEIKLTLQNNNGTTAIYGNNDDIIMDADRYRIRDVNGSAEYIRIVSGGGVGINTNLVAADTNVAVGGTIRVQNSTDASQYLTINHQGINFQNTGAGSSTTSSAHLLDDYEEGTWTPGIAGATTAGSYTLSVNARYLKVGNKVTVWGALNNITTVSAGSGDLRITGLPFTRSTGGPTPCTVGSILLDKWDLSPTSYKYVVVSMVNNVNYINAIIIRDSVTDIPLPITNKINDGSDINFCVTYRVS